MKKPSKNSRIQAQMKEIHAKTNEIFDLKRVIKELREDLDIAKVAENTATEHLHTQQKLNDQLSKNEDAYKRNERFFKSRIHNLETTIFTMNRLFAATAHQTVADFDWSKPSVEEIVKSVKDTFSVPLTPAEREAKIAGIFGLDKKNVVVQ